MPKKKKKLKQKNSQRRYDNILANSDEPSQIAQGIQPIATGLSRLRDCADINTAAR